MSSTARSNGFDGLRIAAAAMVLYGHAFPLTGHTAPGMMANGIQTIGVKIFFVISGYLIAQSWDRSPSVSSFFWKRSLRLFPGLFVLCLLTVFVAGPVLSVLSVEDYFHDNRTYAYFWNVALSPIYFLPGLFEGNIYPNAVNGSLWSLPAEFLMYLCLPAVFLIARRAAFSGLLLTFVTLLALNIVWLRVPTRPDDYVVWGTGILSVIDVACYFIAGAIISKLPNASFRFPAIWISMLLIASAMPLTAAIAEFSLALILPMAVVSFGKMKIRLLKPLQKIDYSYGLYLYGFPIQQTYVQLIGAHSPLTNFLLSAPPTLAMAAISWHLVEKRMLRLKDFSMPKRLRMSLKPTKRDKTAQTS